MRNYQSKAKKKLLVGVRRLSKFRTLSSYRLTCQQHKDKNICRLSMELLDTDDTHSEDPVEVEKWNEYVEKFVGSEEVSLEVKDHLQSKPIFLPRYVVSYSLRAPKKMAVQ